MRQVEVRPDKPVEDKQAHVARVKAVMMTDFASEAFHCMCIKDRPMKLQHE